VATFCTRCGVALSPDKNFCSACGAPTTASGNTDAPAGPPVYSAPATYQTPPTYPPAAAVQPGSGGGALKIILILVAVAVGLGLLMVMFLAFGAWRISRAVHVNRAGGGITLSTPGGTVTTGGASTISDDDLGVPAYPGAVRAQGGMQIHTAKGSMVTAAYTTSDPSSQVLAFYKSKLGQDVAVVDTGQGAIITSGNRDKEGVMITITTNASSKDGATKIVIVHSKNGQP
jgi:hypothetical protein